MDFRSRSLIKLLTPLAMLRIKSFVENEQSYDYEQAFPQRARNQVKLTREWLSETAGGDGVRLAVDIGCADGWHTAVLAEFCDHVLAADVNSIFLKVASRKVNEGMSATFFLADHTLLDQVSSPVDLISLSGLLTYIPSDKEASKILDKSIQLLPPGGYLLVKDTLRSDSSVLRIQRRGNTAIYRLEEEWTSLLLQAGFVQHRMANLDEPVEGFFSRLAFFRKP